MPSAYHFRGGVEPKENPTPCVQNRGVILGMENNKKMYLTEAEAKELGLPSVHEQIERYNKAVLAAHAALSQNATFPADVAYAKSILIDALKDSRVKASESA